MIWVPLAVLASLSRVYIGVHYPADIVAGALFGAAFGAAAVAILRLAARRFPALRIRDG